MPSGRFSHEFSVLVEHLDLIHHLPQGAAGEGGRCWRVSFCVKPLVVVVLGRASNSLRAQGGAESASCSVWSAQHVLELRCVIAQRGLYSICGGVLGMSKRLNLILY